MSSEFFGRTDEDYQARACAQPGVDMEIFFPDPSLKKVLRDPIVKAAKNLCDSCIIRDDCLQAAVERHELNGVWGGVNFSVPAERDLLR